jgi:PAS domain S-box-containing protein
VSTTDPEGPFGRVLETVFRIGGEPILLTRRRDGLVAEASPGFCRLSGFSREQLIGHSTTELGLWTAGEVRSQMLDKLSVDGSVSEFESEFRIASGSLRTCLMSVAVVDLAGEEHLFIVVRDVSPHRHAESRLREAKERYRQLVEEIPAATYVDALDGTPLYVSPQIEPLFGCTRDRVAEWYQGHTEQLDSRVVEYRLLNAGGSETWVHDRVAAVRGPNGEPVVTQGVMVDITDRKRAEQTIRAQEARLRDLLEAMLRVEEAERQRIAVLLHDDTIQVVTAALLVLDRGLASLRAGDGEPVIERLSDARATLEGAIDRTRRLTFDLRSPVLERHGLGPAVAALERIVSDPAVKFRTEVDTPRYPFVIEDLVYRIVQEAVVNAVKHSRASTIPVRLVGREGLLTGQVIDDGVGFDIEGILEAQRMSLHFGLESMMQRIRLAGGELQLRSAPGTGTTVELSLPIG